MNKENLLKIVFVALLVGTLNQVYSQSIEGATGLMKITSAEMQADGTFIAGANYLPDAITLMLSVQALKYCFLNTFTCLVWLMI